VVEWRAHEIKSRREHEWEPPGHEEVIPARSAAHRDKLEEAQKGEAQMLDEDETDLRKPEEEKKKKKRKKRRREHGSDPSPERPRRRDRRPPSSSDRSDGGGHKAKRRRDEGNDLVWVQVPRASLAK